MPGLVGTLSARSPTTVPRIWEFFKRGVWVFKNDIKQLPYVNQDIPCLASPWLQVLVVYNKERRKKNESSVLTAFFHMPFEEKHHALTVQPFFFFTRSRHEKRNYAKIQGNRRKKNQKKIEVSKCIKGLVAKEERKEF